MGLWSQMFNPLEAVLQGESCLLHPLSDPLPLQERRTTQGRKNSHPGGLLTSIQLISFTSTTWIAVTPLNTAGKGKNCALLHFFPFRNNLLALWSMKRWKQKLLWNTNAFHWWWWFSHWISQTLCNPMDCSPTGSSVHGDSLGKNTGVGCHSLFQGSSQPKDQNCICCIAGGFFTAEPPGKPQEAKSDWK